MSQFIQNAVNVSASFNIKREPYIYQVALLLLLYGKNLFRNPIVLNCLRAPGLDERVRLENLAKIGYRAEPGEDDGTYKNALLEYIRPGRL